MAMTTFAFFDYSEPRIFFFLDYLSVMVLFMMTGCLVIYGLGRTKRKLPGICIGEHAIVGAASVVTKDVPDCAVVVGNPAKVVKILEAERFH